MSYIFKNTIILDKKSLWHQQTVDIEIVNNTITHITKTGEIIVSPDSIVVDCKGKFISNGWIDMHVHCYQAITPLSTEADRIGIHAGVPTLIDCGTAGSQDFESFVEQMATKKTDIKAFINISSIGISVRTELTNLDLINEQELIDIYHKFPNWIVGIKVRASGSVVGKNGIIPLIQAQKIARKLDLPIMVHIGNTPPDLLEIISCLKKGDIITHIYNGKANNIFQNGEHIHALVRKAVTDGIIFDVGHGTESFSFEVAKRALAQGLDFDTISTDIYTQNLLGPVYSLANVMSKFLCLDLSLEDIIDKVTTNPARALKFDDLPEIAVGKSAKLTLFDLQSGVFNFTDSQNFNFSGLTKIITHGCFIDGQYYLVKGGI
ncbi:dihydroorotase [Erysipelotrichaceae bacterium]|nr:dihydroorotase [Erysipelotrichaceae bacterium]